MGVLNHFYNDFRAVHWLLRMCWRVDLAGSHDVVTLHAAATPFATLVRFAADEDCAIEGCCVADLPMPSWLWRSNRAHVRGLIG